MKNRGGWPPQVNSRSLTFWENITAKLPALTILLSEPRLVRFDWIVEVSKVPVKALHLGIALLWMASLRNGPCVQLGRKVLAHFSLSRDAFYDGLRRLENEGLIKVWRLPGRRPMITLVEFDGKPLRIEN
jgi:hypothetical protein